MKFSIKFYIIDAVLNNNLGEFKQIVF